ncbi:MAG TPA: hypothetical protein VNB94_07830 [Mycobacteriales bacterium]|nr:hypothetical protein [Mycobacteriales bacterium]
MPVVITGADSPIGALVVDALVGSGLDLRATVDDRGAVTPLVARGVKTAVSDLVDTERFGAVLEGAHTVIHLRGDGVAEQLSGIADVLAAAPDSGLRRIVALAGLAGRHDEHPGLRELESSEYDTVVLEVGVVLAPLADPRAELPSYADPNQLVAPLWVGDLVEALVAADRLRDLHGHIRVPAVGRDVVTAGELLSQLGGTPGPTQPAHGAQDLVGDAGQSLLEVLGVRPRSLAETVRAALAGL